MIRTTSNDCLTSKSKENSSPIRRVRFKFDENHHTQSSDDLREPKKFSVHRVEYQIPIQKGSEIVLENNYLTLKLLEISSNTNSTAAKSRSITSQKIDIHYNHHTSTHLQSVSSVVDSPNVCRKNTFIFI